MSEPPDLPASPKEAAEASEATHRSRGRTPRRLLFGAPLAVLGVATMLVLFMPRNTEEAQARSWCTSTVMEYQRSPVRFREFFELAPAPAAVTLDHGPSRFTVDADGTVRCEPDAASGAAR